MRSDQLGTKLQDDVRDILHDLQAKHPLYFDRIYDSKSTGRFNKEATTKAYIPVRPADFLVGAKGASFYLELKASEAHKSLKAGCSALVDLGQVAKMRLWLRSDNIGYYLFRNKLEDVIEVWNAEDVAAARIDGTRLSHDACMITTKSNRLAHVLGNLFLGLPL